MFAGAPIDFTIALAKAAVKLLKRAGMKMGDIEYLEVIQAQISAGVATGNGFNPHSGLGASQARKKS